MGLLRSLVVCALVGPFASGVRVVTPDGPLVGFERDGFDAFLGIPFAAAPVGALRFKAPEAVAAWDEDLDATSMGPSCLQPGSKSVGGGRGWPSINVSSSSEDCLFANVWAPSGRGRAAALPVMVYVHSGEFRFGSANDGESRWPGFGAGGDAEAVVLVAANSRLGLLGYAGHVGLEANAGLLDQVFLLRWVQRSIGAFGGDAARVTIFGESSGGTCVGFHLVSPLSRNLFQRAILESPGLTQTAPMAEAAANLRFAAGAVTAAKRAFVASPCGWPEKGRQGFDRFRGFYARSDGDRATLNWTRLDRALTLDAAANATQDACAADARCFATSVRRDDGSGQWVAELLGGPAAATVAVRDGGDASRDAALVDLRAPDAATLVACLRAADAADLVRAADGVPYGDSFDADAVAPIVDGITLARPLADLVRDPAVALNAAFVLGGSNKDEGTEFMDVAAPIACDASDVEFAVWAKRMYGADLGRDIPRLYTERDLDLPAPLCRDAGDPGGNGTTWAWRQAMRSAGDGAIFCRTRDLLARAETAFRYEFRVVPSFSVNDGSDMRFLGSFHGAEVPFVFGDTFELKSRAERDVASIMGCYWTSFAAFGDPNAAPCAKARPTWPEAHQNASLLAFDANATSGDVDVHVEAGPKARICDAFARFP